MKLEMEKAISLVSQNNHRLLKKTQQKVASNQKVSVLIYEPNSNIAKYSLVKAMSESSIFTVFLATHDSSFLEDPNYTSLDINIVLGRNIESLIKDEGIDILFLDNPHRHFCFTEKTYDFYVEIPKIVFENTLLCYVPYAFIAVNDEHAFSDKLQRLVWKFFVESIFHLDNATKYEPRLDNCVVTGHPYLDAYKNSYKKAEQDKIKTILWAPHHNPNFYNEISLEQQDRILRKLLESTNIRLIFRPHPNLFAVLKSERHRDSSDYQTLLGAEYGSDLQKFYENHPNVTCEYKGNIARYFEQADLIISNGGGFQMETLLSNRIVINLINQQLLSAQLKNLQQECYTPSSESELEQLLFNLIKGEVSPKYPSLDKVCSELPPLGGSGYRITEHLTRELSSK